MKKSIIALAILSVITISALYIFQYIVDFGLRKSYYGQNAQWTDLYNSRINADVLFMGSSRTQVMVSPAIMDTLLDMDTYNLGFNGWTFDMQYFRFRQFLKYNKKKPKYIVQNVDIGIFSSRPELYSSEQFLPYLNNKEFVEQTGRYIGNFTFPQIYFPMFKYNNKIDYIKEGYHSYMGHGSATTMYKGYTEMDIPWDPSIYERTIKNGVVSARDVLPELMTMMDEYIALCKKNNIKLVFEYAPIYNGTYRLMEKKDSVKNLIVQLAARNDIPFFDYTNDSISYDTKYFYNSMHLNKTGAQVFDLKLGMALKELFKTY